MSIRTESDGFIARPEWQYTQRTEEFDSRGNSKVALAWEMVQIAHRGQERKGGGPYTDHLAAVTGIVRDIFGLEDEEIVMASALHDIVEDCGEIGQEQLDELSRLLGRKVDKIDLKLIRETFGERVAFLVDGVTKLGDDFETVKKVFLKTEVDPWVAVIKLADRLHNMSTLEAMSVEKQIEKSRETLDVYTHLAESLGMWIAKSRLEDDAFRYIDPQKYAEVRALIDADPRLNSEFILATVKEWENWLSVQGLGGRVEVRVKGYWESDRKRKRLIEDGRCRHPESFADVADLVSFRIIVDDLDNADLLRARLRRQFDGMIDFSRSDDYITMPADNGYSAYHETMMVTADYGVEVAITTLEREDFNNWGVVDIIRNNRGEARDYVRIMVFSPNGEMHFLPKGSTGVDYAVAMSPQLLLRAVGMMINEEKVVDIREPVPNASSVFIITGEEGLEIDQSWLNSCTTRAAKKEIIRQQELKVRTEVVRKGKEMMEEILKPRGIFRLEDLDEKEFGQIRFALDVSGRINDIYGKLGAKTLGSERINQKLDEVGVVKEINGVRTTSIRIDGPDIEGTMAQLTSWIADMGGSLSFSTNRAERGGYQARLVIKGLTSEAEIQLKELMRNDELGRFTGVDLV